MKHMVGLAFSSALVVTVALCWPLSLQAADTATNKTQLIEMQMDNDLFLGAEDFFYEFRDVAFIDSVTPEAAKPQIQAAAPVVPQPSRKDRDSSKDKDDDTKPQTETQAPPPSRPPSTDTTPDVPDITDITDTTDTSGDCPT